MKTFTSYGAMSAFSVLIPTAYFSAWNLEYMQLYHKYMHMKYNIS